MAISHGLLLAVAAIGALWFAAVECRDPLTFTIVGASGLGLLLFCAPMAFKDQMTLAIAVTSEGIGVTSDVRKSPTPWIRWEQIARVEVRQREGILHRLIIHGRVVISFSWPHARHRRIVIPGDLPNVDALIRSIATFAPREVWTSPEIMDTLIVPLEGCQDEEV